MPEIARFYEDDLVCARCGLPAEPDDLDRNLWCEDCREKIGRRAKIYGYLTGAGVSALLGLWILFAVTPSDRFLAGWAVILIAAFWLTSKIGREVVFGIYRWVHRPDRP